MEKPSSIDFLQGLGSNVRQNGTWLLSDRLYLGGGVPVAEKRVLLVDDDPDVRELLALGLRSEGYTVDAAGSAARALTYITENHYALVIVDWRLPDGDGSLVATFAERLGAKALLMSGYIFHMPRGRMTEHEMLMKPLQPSEVVAIVRNCIGAPSLFDH